MTQFLIGRRYRSLIEDMEVDDDYGLVTHPAGSTFVVVRHVDGQDYAVAWEQAVNAAGESVPAKGMWTIWSADEIARDAREEN